MKTDIYTTPIILGNFSVAKVIIIFGNNKHIKDFFEKKIIAYFEKKSLLILRKESLPIWRKENPPAQCRDKSEILQGGYII